MISKYHLTTRPCAERCWRTLTALTAMLVLALCTASKATGATSSEIKGRMLQIATPAGRQALLYLPAGSAERVWPLVLFFHGGGGNMQQAARSYGWQQTADQYGFAVLFANGSSRWPGGRLATWHAGLCCGYARDQQIDEVANVRQLLGLVRQQTSIDPQRIFATGMSNGAMLVYRLACEMADTVAAIAAVAGTDNTAQCQPARPVPVFHLHAKDDSHVLFDGGAGADAFRDRTQVTDFTSVDDTVRRWLAHNRLRSVAVQSTGPGYVMTLYRQPQQAGQSVAPVQLLVTDSGGHSWPGSAAVRGKKPAKVAANQLIWQFFAGNARP